MKESRAPKADKEELARRLARHVATSSRWPRVKCRLRVGEHHEPYHPFAEGLGEGSAKLPLLNAMRKKTVLATFVGFLVLIALAFACQGHEGVRPLVVIGIDGADGKVIEDLWRQDRLPHLRALAERGTMATLRTFYNSSPVIWTTVATGVVPERHGILDFVVATEAGDVPVSSAVRRVPAIWNMASAAGRKVLVLGWWASWPAESVRGVVISDRVLLGVENGFFPPERASDLQPLIRMAREKNLGDVHVEEYAERKDLLVAEAANRLLGEGFDLALIYFRSVDVVSHRYWKFYEPSHFENVDLGELDEFGAKIPDSYEAVDHEVGRIVAAAGPETNFIVISDHGFHAREKEDIQVGLDLDRVFERLGFLARTESDVDMTRSRLYTFASGKLQARKKVRFALQGRERGGQVQASETDTIRRELAAALAVVRFENGHAVFKVDNPTEQEVRQGADFVVEVQKESATPGLMIGEEVLEDGVGWFAPVSGGHSPDTHGILIAAGPDIQVGAPLEPITVKDITPTVLYGLALPIAEDFDGTAKTELYTREFRELHPLTVVPTWGSKESEGALASEVDEEVLEDLRALGYIN